MQSVCIPTTAGELGRLLEATLVGDPNCPIATLSALEEAHPGSLSFIAHAKFSPLLKTLKKGVVVLSEQDWVDNQSEATFLIVKEPKKAFARIAKSLVPKHPWEGISSQASVHPSAKIGTGVTIGPGSIVCENVVIGDGTVIYPSVYIGPDVIMGSQCEIHPQVVLLTRVQLGNRVRIFSGSVLGSEGFGFLENPDGYMEMPQLGWVRIDDDVRIGAKCTIDRSTLGDTHIGQGTKIDDQVHIGHNCRVGKNCILCAQVGLAGSSILKDGVILGGQVGVGGHLTIHEKAVLGGQTGVTRDLEGNETYYSNPAIPLTEALRVATFSRKLPELFKRVRKLEEKLNG
ncbi:MAG: UDP-3-O-(3-hydroxymyristoyl)glucosamine N-acyltransferase [Proteobacteria bacterium]|nr:UDP-3-O-(3-hydroxymyristoyl)glucosamine N-acyltransferase [Pseudomonadota bacterium]NDC23921.1 UDP-3-O-(3-hydroxymyristoyl)glucosamine N-acyltransferase [Pseudomonadota bacterium]NDD04601.1 UDP-3-O-(3-hydroxymyristoyl)glucosamine N-acyltransferase [Pseudomonadota bacterium]